MVNKTSIIVVMLLLLAGSLSARLVTYERNWGSNGYNLISSTQGGVEIVFSVERLRLIETKTEGRTMYTVTIPGCFLPNNEGAPNLPGSGRFIAIPQGSRVKATIIAQRVEVIENIDIAPAPPIPSFADDPEPVYRKDARIYNSNADYPASPVMLSEPSKIRGVDCVMIGITPFQYNPVTRRLLIYKDLKVRVDFIGGNGHFGEDRLRNRFWEPILEGHLINYSILPKVNLIHQGSGRDGYEYIIIVPDDPDHEAWADTIKRWRKQQGISTEVFKLSQIGGNNATLIEGFIDSLYNNCTTPPVAVLLLSDYQSTGFDGYGITSPVWNSYCISDNIYADVDHDDLPDIILARICSHDSTHLKNTISKFLSYERQPYTDPNFYNHPLFVCAWQTNFWLQLCTEITRGFMINKLGKDPTRQYVVYSGSPSPGCPWSSNVNTYMLIDYFGQSGLAYVPDSNPYPASWWSGGSASGINQAINSGAFFVQHYDHGEVTGWYRPSYHISDLGGLNNDMYPYVLSINCSSGTYDYPSPCFAEAIHRLEHGAIGVVAAVNTAYAFVSATLIFGIHDGMWSVFDPGYPLHDLPGYENLRPAFAIASGKYYLQASSWPYNPQHKPYTYHQYHHHGGAFITLYSEVPGSLTVSHANQLPAGATTFAVTANDSSIIGLTVNDEIIGVAEGTGSQVSIPIQPQSVGDTMLVTITLYNYYRYMKEVPVVSGGVAESPKSLESRIWLGQTVINDRLVVNYALSNKEKVKIGLYDATGRMIRDFVNANLQGKGAVAIDTRSISAGVYFVRIEKGNDVTTNQVILVR